jgi:PAS domain S-box-containing protein
MTRHRPAPLGVLAAALLGAPAIIWAQEAGAPPSLFTGLAPWLTVALGVIVAAVLLRGWRSPGDASSDRAAALREGEARLEAIMRSAMDAIITIDADQRIVLCNIAAEKMFGRTPDEAIGTSLDRLIPERFRATHRAYIERFANTGETSRRMGLQTALWALRADGTEFPIEASISQATIGGRKLLTVILRDITERAKAEHEIRRAHDELRELAQAMHEVREGERTRIARELHDELGQALTALKMDVDLLGETISRDRTDLLERTDAMRELLDSTVATTRRISTDLRPLVLDDLGLGAAAEWLSQTFTQRTHVPCDLNVDAACAQLGEPQASALFRILQESLTNVAKHAHAKRVEVRLERSGDDAVLTVVDDGVGMDTAARPNPRSFGLRGIGERVMLLGGEVKITSRPGAGTALVVRIPLARAGAQTPAARERA